MPPIKAARGKLHFASIHSSQENLQSPLCSVIPILTQRTFIWWEDEILNECDHDNIENTTNMNDDMSNSVGENMNNVLDNNPRYILGNTSRERKAIIESKITPMQWMIN